MKSVKWWDIIITDISVIFLKKHEGMTPNEYKGNVWKAE